jgi:hypothetical protein
VVHMLAVYRAPGTSERTPRNPLFQIPGNSHIWISWTNL